MPEIMLLAGTRVMLGAGSALLLADKLTEDKRKTIGWTLCLIGAISTIPLALYLFSKRK
jgi:EamA domain-containing membrane protein RarD